MSNLEMEKAHKKLTIELKEKIVLHDMNEINISGLLRRYRYKSLLQNAFKKSSKN